MTILVDQFCCNLAVMAVLREDNDFAREQNLCVNDFFIPFEMCYFILRMLHS